MRQALTFLATIQIDAGDTKMLAVISILAISGAAGTDQLFMGDHQTTQEADRTRRASTLGTTTMLSIDQFLRFISVPAVMAALLIASQVSGAGIFHSQPMHLASE